VEYNVAGAGAAAAATAAMAPQSYAPEMYANQGPAYPQQVQGYQQYPGQTLPHEQQSLPTIVENAGGAAGMGMGVPDGLRDGTMVRVKVSFVRSLEDELAIVPGQQLYLVTAYDDGWSLCEDQNQNRGVVPLSCLEPWDEPSANLPRSNTNGSMSGASKRHSSLYNAPQQ